MGASLVLSWDCFITEDAGHSTSDCCTQCLQTQTQAQTQMSALVQTDINEHINHVNGYMDTYVL